MSTTPTAAIQRLESRFDQHLDTLMDLVRIPSVSDPEYPAAEVARSAKAVCDVMRGVGLENVEVLTIEGSHPYAYGEWLHAEGAPTVLLYGHHDVQPPGRPEKWITPPFEPSVRDGRLYGRGAVDDKAGVMAHIAAIDAFLGEGGAPLNLKFIVEGEEETGSEGLERFLTEYKDRLAADVIVLTDTANLDTSVPSLTYRLRGIVVVDVEVQGLDHPLHSGMWGGPVPCPALGLSRLLAGLVDETGSVAVPGFYDSVRDPDPAEKTRLAKLPFTEATFREQAGLLPGVDLVGEPGYSVWERMWVRPCLSVSAMEASRIKGGSNQIVDVARARVGIRVVPDQDPAAIGELIAGHLRRSGPWGLKVSATVSATGGWWITDPVGPAFDAAYRAMTAGYGVEATAIGCGGSIPFVEPFARVLGGVPALLTGVEDPVCNAHSENESLSIDDWKKAARGSVHLYQELSTVLG